MNILYNQIFSSQTQKSNGIVFMSFYNPRQLVSQ